MKKLAFVLALFLAACSQGMINVDALEGLVEPVAARHDAYVEADDSLDVAAKADFLRSTAILRDILAAAREE